MDDKPEILHITAASVRLPVQEDDGRMGALIVTLKVGESQTILINGRPVTIIRDYLH